LPADRPQRLRTFAQTTSAERLREKYPDALRFHAPRSSLRDFLGKVLFVPASHEYPEWLEPRICPRVLYVFFDVGELRTDSGVKTKDLVSYVFFENSKLWDVDRELDA
jgi:hypothetical protein